MEEPTVPHAVPRRLASTTKDIDVDKDAQYIAKLNDIANKKKAITKQSNNLGSSVLGSRYRQIWANKYKHVLMRVLIRLMEGFFLSIQPKMKVKIPIAINGIKSNLPAVGQLTPNLSTISQFRLSLKEPKEPSAKNMNIFKTQNYLPKLFSYFSRLVCFYPLPFYQLYQPIIDLFIQIPHPKDIKQTAQPMYHVRGKLFVESYTEVVTNEFNASNANGKAKASPASIQYQFVAKIDIITHWSTYRPQPHNPNMALKTRITNVYPGGWNQNINAIIIQEIVKMHNIKIKADFIGDLSIKTPSQTYKRPISKKVEKYIKLKYVVEKLYGSFLKGTQRA